MKAVVKYAREDGSTELREVPVPDIGPEELLVRVEYAGVCGSDPHMHHNNVSYPVDVPLIMGHEFSGTIAERGESVEQFEVGERVTAETHAEYCGQCMLCRTKRYHLCRERKGFGFGVDGAFAKYIRVPTRIIHRLPDNLGFREAALIEPLCVAYNVVVANMEIRPGDIVVVIGPGPIGILCCKIASLVGASEVIVIGTEGDDERLETAEAYGADITVNSSSADPVPLVAERNEGYGADAVIDAAGPSASLRLAMEIVRPDGTINKVAWGPEPVNFSLDPLIAKAVNLRCSFSHTWDTWEKVLKLLAHRQIDLRGLITHEMKLAEWEKAYELVETQRGLKVLLKP